MAEHPESPASRDEFLRRALERGWSWTLADGDAGDVLGWEGFRIRYSVLDEALCEMELAEFANAEERELADLDCDLYQPFRARVVCQACVFEVVDEWVLERSLRRDRAIPSNNDL